MEFISSAFGTASLTWAVYYLLTFFGFEYLADIALIPVTVWTLVAFGSLPVAGIVGRSSTFASRSFKGKRGAWLLRRGLYMPWELEGLLEPEIVYVFSDVRHGVLHCVWAEQSWDEAVPSGGTNFEYCAVKACICCALLTILHAPENHSTA